jgi:hypothetical protein
MEEKQQKIQLYYKMWSPISPGLPCWYFGFDESEILDFLPRTNSKDLLLPLWGEDADLAHF